MRVTARLLDVVDGRQLWADRYDENFTDVFSVQDSIAAKVRSALAPEPVDEPSPLLRLYTEDAEAYELYLRGRFFTRQGSENGFRQALEHFRQAIERDPDFALAHVGLSEGYAILGVFGVVAPHETFPQAKQAVERALELAPDLGEAYASLGHIKVQYEHDWAGAEAAYRRAIELNPYYAPAHQWLGLYLAVCGDFEQGAAQMRQAQSLEPAAPLCRAMIGMLLNYERRYVEAIDQLEKTLEMEPDLPTAHPYLAVSYLRLGEYERAMDHLDRSSSLTPGSAAYRGQILALSRRREDAYAEIKRLIAESQQRYVAAYDIATIYGVLGDVDETFLWLDRAFEDRSQLIGWVLRDPAFDSIRDNPRYEAVVRPLRVAGHGGFRACAEALPAPLRVEAGVSMGCDTVRRALTLPAKGTPRTHAPREKASGRRASPG